MDSAYKTMLWGGGVRVCGEEGRGNYFAEKVQGEMKLKKLNQKELYFEPTM